MNERIAKHVKIYSEIWNGKFTDKKKLIYAKQVSETSFYIITIDENDDVNKTFYYLDKDTKDPVKIKSFIMTEASDKMNIPVSWLQKYDYAELQEEEDVITWLIEEWQTK